MPAQALFGISVVFSFIAWGLVVRLYIWPVLRDQQRRHALLPILVLHSFRFIGLAFLIPGMVSPQLPMAFARPAAFGDLITAVLALAAILTLRSKAGIILVWAFNLVGTADLLNAFYQGQSHGSRFGPRTSRAAYFIPTVLVPLLLITHGLVFQFLFRRDAAVESHGKQLSA